MKSRFKRYLSEKNWLITEESWSANNLGIYESNFTLGNGYVGMRGIYEEIPHGTEPGTYIAGVYDSAASMVPELVNVPNPLDFRIVVEGEKLDMGRMDIVDHERILDMRKGLLLRKTVFSDTKKRRFLYESVRFLSLKDKHIGCMQIYLTSLDDPAKIIVQDTVDDSVTNMGTVLEGRKRHTQLVSVSDKSTDVSYLCVKTFTNKIWIAYATFLAVARGSGQGAGTLNRIFDMTLKKGETVCFTKIFSIHTTRHIGHKKLEKVATRNLYWAKSLGFEKLLKRHAEAWQKSWEKADVKIEGDFAAEKALRFNIYHLIISGNEHDDNVSIGARALTGGGYRGHIFWDTELFILPFFIYTNPKIARNLLMYRFRRLNEARRLAAAKKYKGALFPWESADTGAESAPLYAKNLDGSIMEIHTAKMGHHVAGDIAYGIWHYFTATGDSDFMCKAGLEMLFETARFWSSRVAYNRKIGRYEIKKVIGPDEFHTAVDNSAYTNKMAEWNLRKAREFYDKFNRENPWALKRISKKISLKENEVMRWIYIADRIKIPTSGSKGIIEEFDGYARKKDFILKRLYHNMIPAPPSEISIGDVSKTQLVKQADVLMLLYLFPEDFSDMQKIKNYTYYIKRTLHKSSLSPSIHSIVASEIGDKRRGYSHFLFSAHTDLKNTRGNTKEGMHMASIGGTWQAAIMGFSGFRIMDEMPSFEPRLPDHCKYMEFILIWEKCNIKARVSNEKIKLRLYSERKNFLLVKCFNTVHKIEPNKEYIFLKSRYAA